MAKITGTLQDDTIVGNFDEKDSLNGALGNDVLYGYGDGSGIGGTPPPYLPDSGGPADNDTLNGALGADTLFAGGGNDRLDGGAGADSMDGGDQDDVYFVDNAGDVAAESNADAFGGTDLVFSSVTHTLGFAIENLTLSGKAAIDGAGNAFNNSILGNAAANALSGGDGNDTINGGAGADSMFGGKGNDDFVIDNAKDSVSEFTSQGTDTIRWMRNVNLNLNLFAHIENAVLLGNASVGITGTATANSLGGNAGANVIDGGGGVDIMAGGGGNDTYILDGSDLVYEAAGGGTDHVISSADFFLIGQAIENLTLTGAAIQGDGNELANVIRGNDMNNFINGLGGADKMIGGKGNDGYNVDTAGDKIVELIGGGTDSVTSTITYTLPPEVEILYLFSITAANINGTGNNLANEIYGTDGKNVLNGKGGADTMEGYGGSDTYIVDNLGDITSDNGGLGTDRVFASVDHSIGAGVDDLTLIGKAVSGTGNELSNKIIGTAGANVLSGGAGFDVLYGMAGNDTLLGGADTDWLFGGTGADLMNGGEGSDAYHVDNAGDVAAESDDSSTGDIVQSSITFVLHSTMEDLYLVGGAINGTGNDDNNSIEGSNGANRLLGLAGADWLSGTGGNDTLDGGVDDGSADSMYGGAGNDLYFVGAGDVAQESFPNQGIDTVRSTSSHILGDYIENLILLGTAYSGNGNALNNFIAGNDSDNFLAGNDGNDTMAGGKGNDTYRVENAGDKVVELAGNGAADWVQLLISYVLPANVENLFMFNTSNLNATGNALGNWILGNPGDNVLDGKGGADTLEGGLGNDTLIVDNIGDVTSDDDIALHDKVLASVSHTIGYGVDHLTLTGKASINGTGNAFINAIEGNSGANVLDGKDASDNLGGGGGNDTLIGGDGGDNLHGGAGFDVLDGGLGSDTYRFDKTSGGKDTILNFELGPTGDVLDLSEMLVGYAEGVSNPNDFVRISFVGGNMVLQVDANGPAGGGKFTDVAVLASYPNVTVDELVAGGNLQLVGSI